MSTSEKSSTNNRRNRNPRRERSVDHDHKAQTFVKSRLHLVNCRGASMWLDVQEDAVINPAKGSHASIWFNASVNPQWTRDLNLIVLQIEGIYVKQVGDEITSSEDTALKSCVPVILDDDQAFRFKSLQATPSLGNPFTVLLQTVAYEQ